MSKIKFVYCFSKNLAVNEEQYTISLTLLTQSVKLLNKHSNCRIVTDDSTYNDLKELSNDIEVIDSSNFRFLDDFKLSLIKDLKDNEILVDPDILMFKKPMVDSDVDLIFDYKDSPRKYWYEEDIRKIEGTLLYDKIKSIKKLPFVPNIGFLKINNKTLLTDYIEQYEYYRKDIIERFDNPFLSFSILLGQYLLGILLYEGNYSYLSIRSANTADVYEHLGGPQKFKMLMSNKSLI
jgi:hypothetical protein|tara:strand:- start:599 stop:1306 length:708 start_codon:yes stop_codon:yes gene_type:complete